MNQPPLNEQVLFQATRFRVEKRVQTLEDGSRLTREIVAHPGSVVVLPILEGDRVCLIRNERVAVGQSLIELPAGTMDRDEPTLATAQRELREETGYSADQWRELPGFFMSPGILQERMHVFVAQALTAGDPHREPGENIHNVVVTWDGALELVDRGEIQDAKTIATLLKWDRVRTRSG